MSSMLSSHHLEDLRRSGLSDETIEALGFYSANENEVKEILNFNAGPGLVIPYPTYEGQEPFYRVKPDQPPIINGKQAKYLSPKGAQVRAFIPPETYEALKVSKTPIIITEGEKKAAKANQEGFPCIGLGGVWAFFQEHSLIPDLSAIDWKGRQETIAHDSDITVKPEVQTAIFILEREMIKRGAIVSVIRLKPLDTGLKVGLDDYLIAEGATGLKKLLEQAKPALAWVVEDCAKLSIENRFYDIRNLFSKLAKLDPIELEYYRDLCSTQLDLPRRDFQAQLRLARETPDKEVHVQVHQSDEKSEPIPNLSEPAIEAWAYLLLQDPALLYRLGITIQRLGVAGESANIRLIYMTIASRKLRDPISITLKGESASGKSHTVAIVLKLFPTSAYLIMTGMSKQALVYMDNASFAHRTLVVFERNGAESADYNIRTLQSEGRLIFYVAEKNPETNRWETRQIEKEGPTNFIFTTTSPELHPENETRHWSLLMDESPNATLAAKLESAKFYHAVCNVTDEEIAVWRHIQGLLKSLKVRIPYARWLAEHTPNKPLRMRRDFNKLLALIRIIALLHQYQREVDDDGIITAGIEDYFMARELVNKIFPASLAGINEKVQGLISEVQRLYDEKLVAGEPDPVVRPAEISLALDTSAPSISRWLRPAINAGLVEVAGETSNGRIKSVRPNLNREQAITSLPTTEQLAESFPEYSRDFRAVHPLTGEELALEESTILRKFNNYPESVK